MGKIITNNKSSIESPQNFFLQKVSSCKANLRKKEH